MRLKGIEPEWFDYDGAKFLLQPLNWGEVLELGVLLEAGDLKQTFEFAIEKSVKDWEGVEDKDGPVKFSTERLYDLSVEAVATLAKRVIDANILGAEAEKN